MKLTTSRTSPTTRAARIETRTEQAELVEACIQAFAYSVVTAS